MADNRALSQWEIDALLNQVPAAEAAGAVAGDPLPDSAARRGERPVRRGIRVYDFRRPDKFSREQWATLHSMFETFARIMGASFSSRLRSLVSVRLSSLDQGLYEEWQSQVPSQTACYVMSMRPLTGNIVVEFNSDVASEVVDRLLGGTGLLIDRGREMSEVETALLRSFASVIRSGLDETWSAVLQLTPELQDLGFDAGLIQVAAPTDVVVIAFFEVNIGNHLGAMSICTPYTVIEPIASELSTQVWFQSGRNGAASPEERKVMETLIGRAKLNLRATLGDTMLPASTINEMREGDTIVLDVRLGKPLTLLVGDTPRFHGLPGLAGNRMAIQISDVIEPDELPTLPSSWQPQPLQRRRREAGRRTAAAAAAEADAADVE